MMNYETTKTCASYMKIIDKVSELERVSKGCQKKGCFFSAFLKHFFYSLNVLGVKEKILGIDPRKILTPVPGLKTSYSLSYDFFCETHSV